LVDWQKPVEVNATQFVVNFERRERRKVHLLLRRRRRVRPR
jgi:hypothetical protein